VVLDAPLFDELFAGMVDTNAEGRLVSEAPSGTGHEGFPFTADSIRQVVGQHPIQAAGVAALALAVLRH
jgi:hypothetical protein